MALFISCTHAGLGAGQLNAEALSSSAHTAQKVHFTWRSGFDAGSGQLRAELSDGRAFAGPFAQIRAELGTATQGTYFIGWTSPTWAVDPWFGGPPRFWSGVNTAKTVALLSGPNGSTMRCRFSLRAPDLGLTGGADGQCEVPGAGGSFDVQLFARSR